MKKLKILLIILFSIFFSNIALADVMVPGQNCHSYDETCYNKCISNVKDNKGGDVLDFKLEGSCKEKCCTKEKTFCEVPFATWYYKLKGEDEFGVFEYEDNVSWDCADSGKVIQFFGKHPTLTNILILLLLLLTGIYIYKRKKGKS